MKKMKKFVLIIIATSLFGNFCSAQVSVLSVKGVVAIDVKNKSVKEVASVGNNSDVIYNNVNLTFMCGREMPKFQTTDELRDFLKNSPSKVNGIVELIIDDEMIFSIEIVNGVQKSPNISNLANGSYPCTYPGIKKCAIERIKALNWFDKTLCILEGFGCVVNNYASCMVDNC